MKKKLSLIFLAFFLIIGGVFATPSFEYTQSEVWNDYNIADTGSTYYTSIVASTTNETISVDSGATNYTYSKRFEFPQFSQPLYLKIRPAFDDNMTIMWRGDLNSEDDNLYIQPFQVENEPYIFKFTPSKSDDILVFYVEFDNIFQIAQVEITEEQPKGFSYVLDVFVGAVKDIIDINVTLWKIGFYLFILLVLTAFASTVLGLGIWIFDYIRILKKKRREAENEKYQ